MTDLDEAVKRLERDHREAKIQGRDAWVRPDDIITVLGALSEATKNGPCWDDGPTLTVPGACGPMPPKCELRAGHDGAHQGSGATWNRNPMSFRQMQQERDEALAVIERAHHESIAGEGRSSVVLSAVREILNAAPVDALWAVKAEKFAEGVQHQWTHRPLGNRSPDNPYRAAKGEQA